MGGSHGGDELFQAFRHLRFKSAKILFIILCAQGRDTEHHQNGPVG